MKPNKKTSYRPRDKSRSPIIFEQVAIPQEDKDKMIEMSKQTGLSMSQLATLAINALPTVLTALSQVALTDDTEQQPEPKDANVIIE